MWWRKSSLITRENKIYAINKIEKPQASQSKKDKYISNESKNGMPLDKSRSLDKSRDYKITETEDTEKN